MSVKSLAKIEGIFYAIFAAKIRQILQSTSVISSVKPLTVKLTNHQNYDIIK